MDSLKEGRFVVSYCTTCKKRMWPPYEHCSACYRRASAVNVGRVGKVVEFSRSWLEESEIVVALIDIEGILLLGSISESRDLEVGSKVVLTNCGIYPDGKIYFRFRQQDRFDSYT